MKVLYVCLITVFLSFDGLSQNKSIQFGLDFQPLLTSISNKPEGFFYRSSLFFKIRLKEKLFYSAGIGFTDLGNQNQIVLDTVNIKINVGAKTFSYRKGSFNYKYLYFPLNLYYEVKNIQLIGGIHPYLFYNHEGTITNNYEFYFSPQKSFAKDEINKLNFAIHLGIAYDIPINDTWSVFCKSSASIFTIPIYKYEQQKSVKQISLGLTFGIKRLLSLPSTKDKIQ